MTTIRSLLDGKGSEVWTVAPTDSLRQAVVVMAEKGAGAMPVVDDGGVVGIVSERDIAHRAVLEGIDGGTTAVSEVMTTDVLCIAPDQNINQAMALMTDKRCRHLPVIDDGRLVGLISIGDLVKSVIADQQFTISQLESYISS